MQPRMRMYDGPHKGLRNALSQFSLLVSNTSFTEPEHMDKLNRVGTDLFIFLKQHANDENTVVLPDFEKKEPDFGEHIRKEHHKIDEIQQKVENLLSEIHKKSKTGDSNELRALGIKLYDDFHNFHGLYLNHMLDEEQNIQPLLWKHYTDEELMGFSKKIMGGINPETLMLCFRYIAPAQNHFERTMIMKAMKSAMPAPAFELMLNNIKGVLSEEDFDKLKHEL